jgi:hypothetical protein
MYDLILNIEAIAISRRGYLDAISILFPSVIENSKMDIPLACVLTIAGLLNGVAVHWDLGHGLSN